MKFMRCGGYKYIYWLPFRCVIKLFRFNRHSAALKKNRIVDDRYLYGWVLASSGPVFGSDALFHLMHHGTKLMKEFHVNAYFQMSASYPFFNALGDKLYDITLPGSDVKLVMVKRCLSLC
jgi:hypothetical protein